MHWENQKFKKKQKMLTHFIVNQTCNLSEVYLYMETICKGGPGHQLPAVCSTSFQWPSHCFHHLKAPHQPRLPPQVPQPQQQSRAPILQRVRGWEGEISWWRQGCQVTDHKDLELADPGPGVLGLEVGWSNPKWWVTEQDTYPIQTKTWEGAQDNYPTGNYIYPSHPTAHP